MKQKQGFTLIEILIVVAIIAILASVVLVGLGPTQSSGRDARRLSDLQQTMLGLGLYYNKCGFYPGDVGCGAGGFTQITANGWAQMASVLTSPTTNIGVNTIPNDPTPGRTYYYGTTSGGTSYIVAATLENTSNAVFSSYQAPNTTGFTISGASTATNGVFSGCATPNYCLTL